MNGGGGRGDDRPRVAFGLPDLEGLSRDGFSPADLHVHTRCSDAAPTPRQVVERAARLGIGVAITDHNDARGVREALAYRGDVLVVPGIELDLAEGPHLLLYFYHAPDLLDFDERHVRHRRRGAQYMASCPTADEALDASEGYACLVVAAHPFGYFGLDRGVLKCDAKRLLPGVAGRLDGVEAVCGGMSRSVNALAAAYAEERGVPVTGGSDAHVLRAVGTAVTAVRADSVDGFLDGIRRGESVAAGASAGPVARTMTAGIIACNYVPYAVDALRWRLGARSRR